MAEASNQDDGQRVRVVLEKPPPVPHQKNYSSKKREALINRPFCCDDLLEGDPSCSKANFSRPQLRKCCFNATDIDWKRSSLVGGGRDGYVWKVWFGEDGPYALKVVSWAPTCLSWDPRPGALI